MYLDTDHDRKADAVWHLMNDLETDEAEYGVHELFRRRVEEQSG